MADDPWFEARREIERLQRRIEAALSDFRIAMNDATAKRAARSLRADAVARAARDRFERDWSKRFRRRGPDRGVGPKPDAPEPIDRGPRWPSSLSGGAAVPFDSDA
jgi:hypothetical protein